MSVDYYLTDTMTGKTLPLPGEKLYTEGSTYVIGGWDACELSVTYNYSWLFAQAFDSENSYPGMIEWLHGRIAQDTIPELTSMIDHLGTECGDDYWRPTEGNASHALKILLRFAQAHPAGMWIARG